MARWTDLIPRQLSTVNKNSGGMVEYRGLVLHTAEGGYEGTISWQQNPSSQVSSHFVVGKASGQWAQMMDDTDGAWTQRAGNYHWLSSENEGFGGSKHEPLTGWQVEANAQLLAAAHRRHGVPLQIATDPNGKGLGHHSMGCNWPGGAWGHCECPGPQIIGQKGAILARAQAIVGGTVSTESDQKITDWIDPRVAAIVRLLDTIPSGPSQGEAVGLTKAIKAIAAQVTANANGLADLADMLRALDQTLAALSAKVDALATPPLSGDLTVTGTLHVAN